MSARSILFITRPDILSPVLSRLKEKGYELLVSETLAGAKKILSSRMPDLIFAQNRLADFTAQDLLAELSKISKADRVIVLAEQGTADEARKIMEMGAKDYWLAPLVWEKIKAVLPERAQARPASARQKDDQSSIIGRHPVMKKVLALARQVAPSKATILISGESGTGKEMFARYLHAHSPRAQQAFVAINCAALPEHLLESELFGHEKGAFTGAISRKIGKFELASQGTILLDEISEMDMALQAKLLRVLQESEVDRVGGTDTVKVDVRVLATTNRDIEECVAKKEFRQDLFYRLNVIPLKLPALRERGQDVILLARHFVSGFCSQYRLPELDFDEKSLDWLMEYDWPGNVRELQNLMERAVLLAEPEGIIRTRHFLLNDEDWMNEDLKNETSAEDVHEDIQGPGTLPDLDSQDIIPISEMEKQMIIKGLKKTRGNRTQASEILGISVRTLRNKLNEYKKQGLIL
ncbi:MAG: sigma 54-interacting transcriptional regulator [Desulfonatronovibrionaceae bacterium]